MTDTTENEQSAPVDWQAIARRRERELKREGEHRRRAEQQLAAVRALHQRDDSNPAGPWCGTCMTTWPCPTVQALDDPPADRP